MPAAEPTVPAFGSDKSCWDDAAKTYSENVALASAVATPQLVRLAHRLAPLDERSAYILELGCGTGSLTRALLSEFPTANLIATDLSSVMLAELHRGLATAGLPRVSTFELDMTSPVTSTIPEASFSHIFSTMALQTQTSPQRVLGQWLRLLRPGGVVAIGIWDFDKPFGQGDVWNTAARCVRPTYKDYQHLPTGCWIGGHDLEKGMNAAGLIDVAFQPCHVGFNFGRDEFMRFFWEGDNPAAVSRRAGWSTEETTQLKSAMAKLLKDEYRNGWDVPLWVMLAVGRKP